MIPTPSLVTGLVPSIGAATDPVPAFIRFEADMERPRNPFEAVEKSF
jgi:hypothetical protein